MANAAVTPVKEPPIFAGERCFARARLNLPARLVTFSSTGDCTIVDMSCTGAKIATPNCPRVGSMVVVEGIPMELFGTVRWSGTDWFGIEFDTPMPLDQVVAMRVYADGETMRQQEEQISYARRWATGSLR